MVQFQIANDMRIGELLAIKRVNINYEDKKLDIDGKVNWETEKDGAFGVKETTERSNSYKAIGLTTQSIDLLRTLMLGMISLLIESTYSQIRLVALSTRTKLATLLKGALILVLLRNL